MTDPAVQGTFGDPDHTGIGSCHPSGTMRTFRDDSKRDWTAFKVTPDALIYGRIEALPAAYAQGWLVFESSEERRRFAPCPPEWETFPNAALKLMLQRAEIVRYRHLSLKPHSLEMETPGEKPLELP